MEHFWASTMISLRISQNFSAPLPSKKHLITAANWKSALYFSVFSIPVVFLTFPWILNSVILAVDSCACRQVSLKSVQNNSYSAHSVTALKIILRAVQKLPRLFVHHCTAFPGNISINWSHQYESGSAGLKCVWFVWRRLYQLSLIKERVTDPPQCHPSIVTSLILIQRHETDWSPFT